MATPPKPRKATGSRPQAAETGSRQKGVYVYGIGPAQVELAAEVLGVGDPAGPVRVARCGDLAALVSEVNLAGPVGTPEDLRAHMAMLDATAAELPVLPLRFGAVLAEADQRPGLRQVIEDLARAWAGRIELRLLGPMAAYDFAATTPTGG